MKLPAIIPAVVFFIGGLTSCNQSPQENIPVISTEQATVKESLTERKQIIVDVRTVEEWNEDGHAQCSVNIPLDEIGKHVAELKAYDDIILVCRSGNRAETAKSILQQEGIMHITNKGSWRNINCSP